MRFGIWAAPIVLCATPASLACTCVSAAFPEAPACQQVKDKRTSLFVGKAARVEMMKRPIPPDNYPAPMQVVTFDVQETFGGSKPATLTVTDWAPSNGSCGFPFVIGETYLVDTYLDGSDTSLHVSSCGHTAEVSQADDLLRFLRSIHDESASLFGTVKEYVGKRNFVSRANKPVTGAKLVIRSTNLRKDIVTDSAGWFFADGLVAGQYTVSVETGPEYAHSRPQDVGLSANGCAQIDFRLDRDARQP
jgi:hypothetical protein